MVRTAVPFSLDRTIDPKLTIAFAQNLAASGVVDDFMAWDQVQGWWPRELYSAEHTPLAEVMQDPDSFHDAFILAAIAGATSGLGVVVTTDAIRRGPGELLMTMMTLAGVTDGRATLMLGAGEAKQARPLGYKRTEGLTRLEDFFKVRELFMNADAPFDFEGHHWTMKSAWLGSTRPHKPKVWAMGGGPQLMKLAAAHADGFTTMMPMVFSRIDDFADHVASTRAGLAANGRDPDAFDFSIWIPAILHEDQTKIDAAFDNALLKFIAAVFGRLNQADWDREGLEPIFPRGWHYALKFIPTTMSKEQAEDVVARTPRQMVQKSFLWGRPDDVAKQVAPFVEAGASHVAILDTMLLLLPLDEAFVATNRSIGFCRNLKTLSGAGA